MAAIILLGAGASYGSRGVEPYAPPLGAQLFPKLLEESAAARSMPEEIKEIFEDNFEAGMAAYYEHSNGNIMSFQRELAEYLAKFKPKKDNIYIQLIKQLGNSSVIYSSLNYDLLFEQSAIESGFGITYSDVPKKQMLRLLKFHGSSNFWPDMGGTVLKGCQIFGSGIADIQAPIKAFGQQETLNKCRTEDSLSPAIAMFAVGKKVKISPDFVENQYVMWKQQISKSTKVFVVGVRVHEVDEHIWTLLGETKGKVTYFGFESDEHEFNEWKDNHNKKNAYFYKSDFQGAVDIIKNLCKR